MFPPGSQAVFQEAVNIDSFLKKLFNDSCAFYLYIDIWPGLILYSSNMSP